MTTEKFFIKIEEDETARRLDKFLALKLPSYSRSYFQQLIKKGRVAVNGKTADQDYSLKVGDLISGEFEAVPEINVQADSSIKFKVIYDVPGFAVIEKPAGLVTHPSYTHKTMTLVNGLIARWPEMANVGDHSAIRQVHSGEQSRTTSSGQSAFRPGIVHRLDKETSGLMVVAKDNSMYLWLKNQFQERQVVKKYTALVYGEMKQMEGEISAPIARAGDRQIVISNINKGFSGKPNKSRNASTGFKVLALYDGFTLVEAIPKTGRMHQIRVHLKYIVHPVVGDKKYASLKALNRLPIGRHFLHASYLAFNLPSGENVEFKSDLPSDLKKTLSGLEKKCDI
ncbi:MAG: RluA family pseudouridine synthase [Patescibacteria group bacterium]